jgi:hypothetical protein
MCGLLTCKILLVLKRIVERSFVLTVERLSQKFHRD